MVCGSCSRRRLPLGGAREHAHRRMLRHVNVSYFLRQLPWTSKILQRLMDVHHRSMSAYITFFYVQYRRLSIYIKFLDVQWSCQKNYERHPATRFHGSLRMLDGSVWHCSRAILSVPLTSAAASTGWPYIHRPYAVCKLAKIPPTSAAKNARPQPSASRLFIFLGLTAAGVNPVPAILTAGGGSPVF